MFLFYFKLYRLPKKLQLTPGPQLCITLFVSGCLNEIVIVVEINLSNVSRDTRSDIFSSYGLLYIYEPKILA